MIRFLFSLLLKDIPNGEFVGLFCWVVLLGCFVGLLLKGIPYGECFRFLFSLLLRDIPYGE